MVCKFNFNYLTEVAVNLEESFQLHENAGISRSLRRKFRRRTACTRVRKSGRRPDSEPIRLARLCNSFAILVATQSICLNHPKSFASLLFLFKFAIQFRSVKL